MKPTLLPAVSLLALILLSFPAFSQEITQIQAQGNCRDFSITVAAEDIGEGCWDVKLDVPGQIKDKNGNWKSTFFYVERALCSPETEAVLDVRLEGTQSSVEGTAKLRQGSKIVEMPFTVVQACPEPPASLEGFWVVFAAFAIIVIFGWIISLRWKHGEKS